MDDLQFVVGIDGDVGPAISLDDLTVVLDGDKPGLDVMVLEKVEKVGWAVEPPLLTVYGQGDHGFEWG